MPLLILVTIANRGGFIQAPINKTKFSCRVFRNVPTYNNQDKNISHYYQIPNLILTSKDVYFYL